MRRQRYQALPVYIEFLFGFTDSGKWKTLLASLSCAWLEEEPDLTTGNNYSWLKVLFRKCKSGNGAACASHNVPECVLMILSEWLHLSPEIGAWEIWLNWLKTVIFAGKNSGKWMEKVKMREGFFFFHGRVVLLQSLGAVRVPTSCLIVNMPWCFAEGFQP